MSKKKTKTKIIIPNHGFSEHYLTWQIGNCSQHSAHVFGIIRFIIFAIVLPLLIVILIYLPHRVGYGQNYGEGGSDSTPAPA